jgi:enoyl-CoA hydratase
MKLRANEVPTAPDGDARGGARTAASVPADVDTGSLVPPLACDRECERKEEQRHLLEVASQLDGIMLELDGQVAVVTLDRPKALNVFNESTLKELDRLLDAIAADEGVDVVLLRSSHPKLFTAGADINEMLEKDVMGAKRFAELGHRIARKLETLPQPVIAAVNGFVMGGGVEFISACDIRIASDDAVLAQPEIDIGIIPGWGGTQRLARLVGLGKAKELIYTGRHINAGEALRIGLVNQVVPRDRLAEVSLAMAKEIAGKSHATLVAAKLAINMTTETNLATGLQYEVQTWATLFETMDQKEGMQAFKEKRPPRFRDQ